ncbi:hypothetical protein GCM10023219_29900 [Stakelama sediminis]
MLPLTYGRSGMATYSAFARDHLLTGLIILAGLILVASAIFWALNRRKKQRREAAWRLKRAEQDRIWHERGSTK